MAAFKEGTRKRVTNWLIAERGAVSVPLFDFSGICRVLRPGDVLLVEGCSRVSTVIRHITHSTWTHSALYVGTLEDIRALGLRHDLADTYELNPDEPLMVESLLGEGTILAPVSKYRDNHLRICRPVGLSEADTREVVTRVLDRLGTAYDARELLESALLLIWERLAPHRRSRWFNNKVRRPDGAICSSMLGQAFTSVGHPVLPVVEHGRDGQRKHAIRAFQLLTPRDFDHSPSFEVIKCPVEGSIRRALVPVQSQETSRPRNGRARRFLAGWVWGLPHWLRRKRRSTTRAGASVPETDTGTSD